MDTLNPMPISALRGQDELKRLTLFGQAAKSGNLSGASEEARLQNVAKKFDALFARQLLKEMRNSVLKSSLFGDSVAGEIYQEMFDDHLADSLAEAGGFGIGAMVIKDLAPATARMSVQEAAELYEQQTANQKFIPFSPLSQAIESGQKTERKGFSLESQPAVPGKILPRDDEYQSFELKSDEINRLKVLPLEGKSDSKP